MNDLTGIAQRDPSLLIKPDPHAPALKVLGRDTIAIKAGMTFGGYTFAEDAIIPPGEYAPGSDYIVRAFEGVWGVARANTIPEGEVVIGGFHFAPGGNASARAGGDDIPAINPRSLWDRSFRPACPDPRGMALVDAPSGRFWCDIYLTGVNHLADGTSKFGVTIADGDDRPFKGPGERYQNFDYETACAVMALHGKGLLSFEEFFAAAYGVVEKTAAKRDPKITGLDAPRTSKYGLMQATGNLWAWGHDGDPDAPRASILGGSWLGGDYAGSRSAYVDYWPDISYGGLGARGRSDHLQPE